MVAGNSGVLVVEPNERSEMKAMSAGDEVH